MPIRSTGCLACRRRKIKCDEEKPGCKKCRIHGIACPGYRTSQPGSVDVRDQTYTVVARVKVDNSRAPADLRDISFLDQNHLPPCDGLFPRFALPQAIPIPVNGAALNRIQLISATLYLLLPGWQMSKQQFSYLIAWSAIGSTPAKRPTLCAAVDTLSLVFVGMTYRDDALLLEAKRRYGAGLSELTKALSQPDVFDDTEIFAAITFFKFFELLGPLRQYGSFVSHMRGAGSFLMQRGPKPLESISDTMLFHQSRQMMVLYGLVERKTCILASPEWLEVAENGLGEDHWTTLLDILVFAPGLLGQSDELLASPESEFSAQAVLSDLVQLITSLQDWFADFQASLGDEPYTLRDTASFRTFNRHVQNDRTFPSAYLFPSFMAAYLHEYYWMSLCALQKAALDVLSSRSDLICPWMADHLREEVFQHIIDICLCLPFLCEPQCGYSGILSTTAALNMVLWFFRARQMKPQEQWCAKIATSLYCPSYGVVPVWMDDWNPVLMRAIGA